MIKQTRVFYGWVIVGVATLGVFASGPGQTFTISVFVDPMLAELGWSRTAISALYTAGSLSAAGLMLLVGRVLDRWGSRLTLTAIALLFGMSVMAMSRISEPLQMWAGFIGIRLLGQGALPLVSTVLVTIWFRRLRGRATAVVVLGIAAAAAVFPPLSHALISELGWRQAWVVLGLLVWGLLVLPAALLTRRSPESEGLAPDGAGRWTVPAPASGTAANRAEPQWTLRAASGTHTFWLLLLAASTPSFITTALFFHHVSFLGTRMLDPGVAANVFAVLTPSLVLGMLGAGYVADQIPVRYVLVGVHAAVALAIMVGLFMLEPWHAGIYVALLGLGTGAWWSIIPVLWASYYGRRHLGAINSSSQTAKMVLAALAPLPVGFVLDQTGDYTIALLGMLTVSAVSAVAAALARPPVGRPAL